MRDSQKTMIAHAQNRGRMDSLSVKYLIVPILADASMRKRQRTTAIVRHCTKVRQGQFTEAIRYLDSEIAKCLERCNDTDCDPL